MASRKESEDKIKELNAKRATDRREFELIEKRYQEDKISKESYERHEKKYQKQVEKIKEKIRKYEEEME